MPLGVDLGVPLGVVLGVPAGDFLPVLLERFGLSVCDRSKSEVARLGDVEQAQ